MLNHVRNVCTNPRISLNEGPFKRLEDRRVTHDIIFEIECVIRINSVRIAERDL